MRKALTLLVAVGALLALTAARPGTEQQLVQQLNGQPVRVLLPDSGPSGVFTQYDAGTLNDFGCMPLTGLKVRAPTADGGAPVVPNVLLLTPLVPVNVCIRPSVGSLVWDGGCNAVARDENYGVPMAANVPQYVTPDSAATRLCAYSDAGYVQLPVWWVQ